MTSPPIPPNSPPTQGKLSPCLWLFVVISRTRLLYDNAKLFSWRERYSEIHLAVVDLIESREARVPLSSIRLSSYNYEGHLPGPKLVGSEMI